jgi:hypothetical protein
MWEQFATQPRARLAVSNWTRFSTGRGQSAWHPIRSGVPLVSALQPPVADTQGSKSMPVTRRAFLGSGAILAVDSTRAAAPFDPSPAAGITAVAGDPRRRSFTWTGACRRRVRQC